MAASEKSDFAVFGLQGSKGVVCGFLCSHLLIFLVKGWPWFEAPEDGYGRIFLRILQNAGTIFGKLRLFR